MLQKMSKLIKKFKVIAMKLGIRRQLAHNLIQEFDAKLPILVSSQDSNDQFLPIPDDLLFKILILLPAASLFTMQFVCKKWHSLINTTTFITSHSQQSETVMLCNCSASLKPSDPDAPARFLRLLDLGDGANAFVELPPVEPLVVQTSRDGLILATAGSNSTALILVNPITRKHVKLPLGLEHRVLLQSFGLAFCDRVRAYKIVHLFVRGSGDVGCRVMCLSTGRWRGIGAPRGGLIPDTGQNPVFANGSLYWLFGKAGCECDHLVSLSLTDEKFVSRDLPTRGAPTCQLLEIGGCLGLAMGARPEGMEVWVLVSGGEKWIKKYSFGLGGYGRFPRAVCCSRNGGRIVVEKGNCLYVCDFETGETKVIHSSRDIIWDMWGNRGHIPHRNTLVSWDGLL